MRGRVPPKWRLWAAVLYCVGRWRGGFDRWQLRMGPTLSTRFGHRKTTAAATEAPHTLLDRWGAANEVRGDHKALGGPR